MSMTGQFFLASDERLSELLADPALVHDACDAAYDLAEQAYAAGEKTHDDFVEVEKAWHAIHYLLTGTSWNGDPPLAFVLVGGRQVGDEDVGYGPARAFTSAEVAETPRRWSRSTATP